MTSPVAGSAGCVDFTVTEERRALVASLIDQGWVPEPSRRAGTYLLLRHPSGVSGASKLLVYRHTGTSTLYGPSSDRWRVDFRRDVPNAVILGALSHLGGRSEGPSCPTQRLTFTHGEAKTPCRSRACQSTDTIIYVYPSAPYEDVEVRCASCDRVRSTYRRWARSRLTN